ncbi:amino acid ABC transporter ATP-binding/permease protein [Brachybacterium alimentarium]|uniref:amino acid ABC transporter ATP-binding/permease protein n=1 Tax=Brachybacterium alimentarium TaxID=47845 RepID=UPI000DF2464C|nr:ABC transporter ATP-binding protein [Brachybacterium alimentarium]RCS66743.1 ABC transporter ATP-binding protein [Brachybacterium alimentarium]RCS76924.1 ABC transporter ATP-binding protein [Brachybacterium alimentarium]RCS91816.1 ABC transporter ATP-binding protein [Brachybacterium alimentarium]
MTQRNRPMTDLRWLLAFAAPARGVLAVSVLARLLGHTASAAALALPAWAIGAALTQPGDLSVLVVVAGLIVLALAAGALRYLEQLTGHLAAFRLLGELRIWVMHRVLPQAPAVIDVRGAARVLDVAVRDVDRIEVFFAHTIAPAISAVLLPAAAIGFTAATAGPPTALSLALVLAAGWAVSLLGRGAGRQTARVLGRARGDITQHVADSLRVRDVIQGAGTLEERLAAMRELDARLGAALTARSRRAGVRHGATAMRVWGGTLLVLLVGLATAPGALPAVLLAAALVPGTATGLDTLERLAVSLPAGLEATRRVRELAEASPLVPEPSEPTAPTGPTAPISPISPISPTGLRGPGFSGVSTQATAPAGGSRIAAELTDVTFRYPDRPDPVLESISLHLAPGTTVGITGPTGSGKSTIARLLQRHRDPEAGTVTIDGVDARRLGSTQVQRIVAVADQDPFLLDATVAANLRLAAPGAPDAALEEVLRTACSPLPLDRCIGPRGSALSGGERQRLALARTVLRAGQAPGGIAGAILVLDEATSHQDPLTQERVVAGVQRLGTSTVVIAHRHETLRPADHLIHLENGRVVPADSSC